MKILLYYLAAINAVTFTVFASDKARAVKKATRISEKTLMCLAVLGGSAGALLSMAFFRHKTKKPLFAAGIPIILAAQLAAVIFIMSRV